ncbi:MAG: PepSY domain-containing protein [Verrucomicrobiaceae bacterium]
MSDSSPKRRRRVARQWHRWLGVLAAFPLLWLSVSGLLLNHAERLGFHDQEVTAGWVLKRYHQMPEGEPVGLEVGDRMVSEWDGMIFVDGEIVELPGELVGAVGVRNHLVIATPERVGVFDGAGEMIIDLDELSLPGVPVLAVGEVDGLLQVRVDGRWWAFGDDYLSFEESGMELKADGIVELSEEEKESLSEALRSRSGMPMSRVILDAHSGRLFGWPGWVLTDLAAVSVIVLTIMGLRLFPKRKS